MVKICKPFSTPVERVNGGDRLKTSFGHRATGGGVEVSDPSGRGERRIVTGGAALDKAQHQEWRSEDAEIGFVEQQIRHRHSGFRECGDDVRFDVQAGVYENRGAS